MSSNQHDTHMFSKLSARKLPVRQYSEQSGMREILTRQIVLYPSLPAVPQGIWTYVAIGLLVAKDKLSNCLKLATLEFPRHHSPYIVRGPHIPTIVGMREWQHSTSERLLLFHELRQGEKSGDDKF